MYLDRWDFMYYKEKNERTQRTHYHGLYIPCPESEAVSHSNEINERKFDDWLMLIH